VLVPLDHAAALTVQVRLHAFKYPGAPVQTLTLAVNGRRHGPVPVPQDWETLGFETAEPSWKAGVNQLALELAWARRPSDVGLGGDVRPLAAAVDYIRVEKR
jgi:hypothetical protein